MNHEIRQMNEEDLEECAAVIREGFLTVAREFGFTVESNPSNGAFIQKDRLLLEKEKGHIMFGMITDNRIIGYMQLEKNTEELYFLQKLVVLPEYRHQGFGRKLLEYAKKKVKELSGKRISIAIIEENTILKNWYLDYGFVHTDVKKFEHLPFTVGFMELQVD